MAFEGGTLNMALAAAVGDDAGLVRDLRRAFLESADRQIDMLSRALDDSSWHLALWRLKGLCGSFGVVHMIALIEEAQGSAPGDAKTLARIRAMLSVLGED